MFCLYILNDEQKYEIQFMSELNECLQKFRGLLYIHDKMNNIEIIHDKISELSYLLIIYSDYDKKFSIVKYFNEILDYDIDYERWKKSSKYTPTIAQLLFCIKMIDLEYYLS